MKIKIYLVICFLGILTIRCSKEEADITCEEQGITEQYSDALVFDTGDKFHALLDSLLELPMNEQLEYSRRLNFESLLSLEYEALDKLDNATTDEEYENILSQYDIFEEEDSILSLKIAHKYMAPLLNKYGIVIINGFINKYTKDESLHCKVEDFNELLNYEINGVESEKVDVFKNKVKTFKLATEEGCTDEDLHGEFKDGEKKGIFGISLVQEWTTDGLIGGQTRYRFTTKTHSAGIAYKKNIFGKWKMFKTDHVMHLKFVFESGKDGTTTPVNATRTQTDWPHIQYTKTVFEDYGIWNKKEDYLGTIISSDSDYSHDHIDGSVQIDCP